MLTNIKFIIVIHKKISSKEIEKKWYDHWEKKGYFYSNPDKRIPYTIVIPPPNVTGVLHMGHMLNNTIQDVLVRRARMRGFNTCWVPGTDHASIATEAKVVKKLSDQGIEKSDLSREEFLEHAFRWKEEHGGIILNQLKKIGASCDWKRVKFTMDNDMNESVIQVFIDLYKKGLIYRGVRMINWDPTAKTAVSDEEVIHKEIESKLFYISYQIEKSKKNITIATTRPETILGDSAICVNPNDNRYKDLKGKTAIVPLIGRKIPIIFDEYVDMDFGTGALKITPAHDINDYEIGNKHNLEIIDILNDDGTLNKKAQLYIGEDRFKVRNEIATVLEKNGHLVKIEAHTNKVGFSERTNSVIEPKLSMQWFCKMTEISKPALENVMNDTINFFPNKFKNTYRHWMTNIKDWCLSRQLWWGQRIPAYYYEGNKFVVAKSKKEALEVIKKENPNITIEDINQDEDVLDTWFSSWLWPISVFDGIRNPGNKEIKYYYPTNDLVTAPEILFFWVARMIIAGYEYQNDLPFKNVYLTGIVRDKKGRKMSKSLGNSPDPLKLIDKYSADGVRVGMLLCSPAGNDLPFDESLCEQGRNFSNKIWNSYRLINGWTVGEHIQPEYSKEITYWFENQFNRSLEMIENSYSQYRISEALMTTYKLFWDDFCSCYLEVIKPKFGDPIDQKTYNYTINFLSKLMQILHPFMPFITEEIWRKTSKNEKDIIVSEWPKNIKYDNEVIEKFSIANEVVKSIRKFRKEKEIPNKSALKLIIKSNNEESIKFDETIIKLCNIESIKYNREKPMNSFGFMVSTTEYFIPFEDNVNTEKEKIKLNKELEYQKGFLKIIQSKLSNKNFIEKAPENLIKNEEKKLEDTKLKIESIIDKINEIN